MPAGNAGKGFQQEIESFLRHQPAHGDDGPRIYLSRTGSCVPSWPLHRIRDGISLNVDLFPELIHHGPGLAHQGRGPRISATAQYSPDSFEIVISGIGTL